MDMNFILASIGVFLVTILLLVVILLVAKKYLSPSGNVNITINGDKTISVAQYAGRKRCIPVIRLWWQGFLRTVQMSGGRRRR